MTMSGKHGYKETAIGWIPEHWDVCSFGSLLATKPEYGANASAEGFCDDSSVRYLRITDIDDSGRLINSGKKYIPEAIAKNYLLADEDILIARTGNTVGKSLIFRQKMGRCAFAGYLIRFRVGEKLDCNFAGQYFHSDDYWAWVKGASKVGAQPNINAQQYQSISMPLPPVLEQRKIAAILAAVDAKLDVIARQITTTETLKKGLIQLLFSQGVGTLDSSGYWVPHREFKRLSNLSVPATWEERHLGQIAPLVRRPVEVKLDAAYPELGLRSFGKGTFHKPALSGTEVGNKRLFQIKEGDLLLSNVFAWEGAIAVAKPEDDGRYGSHRYITCKVDASQADTLYVFRFLTTPRGIALLTLASPGGAGRNKTLGLSALANIAIPLPPLVEQQKITAILDGVDSKISMLNLQQSLHQTLKRGLMQKLLSGKLRVKLGPPIGDANGAIPSIPIETTMTELMEETL